MVDISSDNGFMTTVFGPITWTFLHILCQNFPLDPSPDDKKTYRAVIENTFATLPCKPCRDNVVDNLEIHPLVENVFEDRQHLVIWMISFHNVVNRMLGKPRMSIGDAMENIERFRAGKCRPSGNGEHGGCTVAAPANVKSRCVLQIIPVSSRSKKRGLVIDKRCIRQ